MRPALPITLLAVATTLCFAGSAQAIGFGVDGQVFPGMTTADVNVEWDDVDTLTITICNTADPVMPDFLITGFGINVPPDVLKSLVSFSAVGDLVPDDWAPLSPAGKGIGEYVFDLGAATGPTLSNPKVESGIPIGGKGVFTFVFELNPGSTASVEDFWRPSEGGGGPAHFGVRFQDPNLPKEDFSIPVPEPGLALLLSLGLAALRFRRA